MATSYTASERQALAAAMESREAPNCPACGTAVSVHRMPRPDGVAYVRNRVWIFCPGCKRTVILDAPYEPPGHGTGRTVR